MTWFFVVGAKEYQMLEARFVSFAWHADNSRLGYTITRASSSGWIAAGWPHGCTASNVTTCTWRYAHPLFSTPSLESSLYCFAPRDLAIIILHYSNWLRHNNAARLDNFNTINLLLEIQARSFSHVVCSQVSTTSLTPSYHQFPLYAGILNNVFFFFTFRLNNFNGYRKKMYIDILARVRNGLLRSQLIETRYVGGLQELILNQFY